MQILINILMIYCFVCVVYAAYTVFIGQEPKYRNFGLIACLVVVISSPITILKVLLFKKVKDEK